MRMRTIRQATRLNNCRGRRRAHTLGQSHPYWSLELHGAGSPADCWPDESLLDVLDGRLPEDSFEDDRLISLMLSKGLNTPSKMSSDFGLLMLGRWRILGERSFSS